MLTETTIDEILKIIEQVLSPKRLSSVERLILQQTWSGQTYLNISQDTGYSKAHLKEVGSQLWQDLSRVFGQRVTKKNVHLVLQRHQQSFKNGWKFVEQQRPPRKVERKFSRRSVGKTKLEFPSCSLPPNSPLYIRRPPIEELALAEMSKPGCLLRIEASRHMGKTSMLNQSIAHAKVQGYNTAILDLQEADETVFISLDKFLRWFCVNISRQLNLNPILEKYWDEDMGSKVSCKIYFERYLLEQIDSPLVLSIDEVNRIFEYPYLSGDFLSMLRYWHEQLKSESNWQKLRLILSCTTETHVPLKFSQFPFNIGLLLKLPQFTLEQVQDLARRCGLTWMSDGLGIQDLTSLYKVIGGHPYLINLAFYRLSRQGMSLAELLKFAPTQSGIYSHYLRDYLTILQGEPQLALALQQVVTASESVQLNALAAHKLESMGLIQLKANRAKPTCELYRLYFSEQLSVNNS